MRKGLEIDYEDVEMIHNFSHRNRLDFQSHNYGENEVILFLCS